MKTCHLLILFGLLATLFMIGCQGDAKNKTDVADTEPVRDVPAMDAFMAVLENAMHAEVDSNYQTLRETAPQFTAALDSLSNADLPEFHQDVKEEFAGLTNTLSVAVEGFVNAAGNADDVALEEALTTVRKAYIHLWTLLTPAVPEIDDFHTVLRPIWHQSVPNEDWGAVKAVLPKFESTLTALGHAKLPEKYAYAQLKYDQAVHTLKTAYDSLKTTCDAGQDDLILDKMTDLHDAFHALQEFYE
ncbi:MAG: hypothetical protein JW763_11085 [candidate division Zixibacteria bacterium]|nr:hypothetical protein [candidate division Zixibacteria bacterium]